jgi:hypothetical protein
VVAALTVLHLTLASPPGPGEGALAGLVVVPVELAVLLAALVLAPARWRRPLRHAALAFLAVTLVLELADLAAVAALGRAFHPVFDLHLAAAGWNLATGTLGTATATAAAAAAVGALALALLAAHRALAVVESWLVRAPRRPGRRIATAALAGAVAASALVPGVRAGNAALVERKLRDGVTALASMRAFERRTANDALAEVPTAELFAGLGGRDVLFLVVESYGRTALDHPRYAAVTRDRLRRFETALAEVGYGARSGWLTAPVKGGQSWLAHATLLAGLRIDHQQRYGALLASERRSLIHGFARAGWRTAAVMPAITMPWPEGNWFGYDATYTAAELGYAGEPFNWVTMPDQYTLSALERLELAREGRPPVMAEVALISSHAPWTPIPPVLDWDEIGDGRVFTPHARAGDPPAVVWRDAERVRAQYLKAIDYALANLASYVETFGRDDRVLVVVGDHQPAPLVTGEGAGFDVPIHVVAAPEVLDRLDGWGWSAGMTPSSDLDPWPMAAFRDRFVEAFSGAPPPPAAPVQASDTDNGA